MTANQSKESRSPLSPFFLLSSMGKKTTKTDGGEQEIYSCRSNDQGIESHSIEKRERERERGKRLREEGKKSFARRFLLVFHQTESLDDEQVKFFDN